MRELIEIQEQQNIILEHLLPEDRTFAISFFENLKQYLAGEKNLSTEEQNALNVLATNILLFLEQYPLLLHEDNREAFRLDLASLINRLNNILTGKF